MRGARWHLVLAILAIVGGIGATYRFRKADQEKHALSKPAALPSTLSGKLEDWQWARTDQGHPIVQIRARDVKQEKDSNKTQLERVELRLYNKEGDQFDLVRSARAEFDQSADRLFSGRQVDITSRLPAER